jgi:hypothetical protein
MDMLMLCPSRLLHIHHSSPPQSGGDALDLDDLTLRPTAARGRSRRRRLSLAVAPPSAPVGLVAAVAKKKSRRADVVLLLLLVAAVQAALLLVVDAQRCDIQQDSTAPSERR